MLLSKPRSVPKSDGFEKQPSNWKSNQNENKLYFYQCFNTCVLHLFVFDGSNWWSWRQFYTTFFSLSLMLRQNRWALLKHITIINGTACLKNVNNRWNTNIYFYLETSAAIVIKIVCDLRIFIRSFSVCKTKLEKYVKAKHSSFLQKLVNYEQKKFYNIGPWWSKHLAIFKCCSFFQHHC